MVYLKEPNDFKADAQKSEFTFTHHCTELKGKTHACVFCITKYLCDVSTK